MDIEIERRADVGVAQYDAHGLVVAVARTNFASDKIVHERQAARAILRVSERNGKLISQCGAGANSLLQ